MKISIIAPVWGGHSDHIMDVCPMQPENPTSQLRDQEIRIALRDKLKAIHAEESDTAIIDELSLCQGDARVGIIARVWESRRLCGSIAIMPFLFY